MKALTLWQPWASLIACEAKEAETRSWPAPASLVGCRIAIHAAARPVRQCINGLPDVVWSINDELARHWKDPR